VNVLDVIAEPASKTKGDFELAKATPDLFNAMEDDSGTTVNSEQQEGGGQA
jgi:hypothetical protein